VTDQIVPVPLNLLLKYKRDYPVSMSQSGALSELAALIPAAPPKVGDTVTVQQMAELPYQSVVVDEDEDVWVAGDGGQWFMAVDGSDTKADPKAIYAPYTLVYLPRD
jgi:hypothetical protein